MRVILPFIVSFVMITNILGQNSKVEKICKFLVVADYMEFSNVDSTRLCDESKLFIEELPTKGFSEIKIFKIKFRDLESLKFTLQPPKLKESNGFLSKFSEEKFRIFFKDTYGSLDSIDEISFYEQKIGIEKFINNEVMFQGDFIIAYVDGKFLRLKGFRYNDFALFFYKYLNAEYLASWVAVELEGVRGRRRNRKLKEMIVIPELSINALYRRHIRRREFRDKNSCYMRQLNFVHPH